MSKQRRIGRIHPIIHFYLCSAIVLSPTFRFALVGRPHRTMNQEQEILTTHTIPEIQITFSTNVPQKDRTQLRGSENVDACFRQIWPSDTLEYNERFYVLCLTRSNHVIGYMLHSIGGIAGTVVDIKLIIAASIKANAASIILAHNHPSGNKKPSQSDINLTRKIVEAAAWHDMSVLDHLILTKDKYYSFADEGVLPTPKAYKIAMNSW